MENRTKPWSKSSVLAYEELIQTEHMYDALTCEGFTTNSTRLRNF